MKTILTLLVLASTLFLVCSTASAKAPEPTESACQSNTICDQHGKCVYCTTCCSEYGGCYTTCI